MLPPKLAATAAQKTGLFCAADALKADLTRTDIVRALREERWVRVVRGVFMERELWESLDERGQLLARGRGRLMVVGDRWALARRTVVEAHQLQRLGKVPEVPQLLGDKDRAKARNRHERIATLPDEHVIVVDGFRNVTLERTVVDIARQEGFRSAVVIADSALRHGASAEQMTSIARLCRGWPGGLNTGGVLAFADGRAETALESISRVGFRTCDLPMPEPQVEVYLGSRLIARLDFFWEAYNLVGECDGRMKYGDTVESYTEKLYAEKLREELLESLGFEVVRWDWSVAWNPLGELDVRILRGMEQGRLKTLDPRVRLVRTSVPLLRTA